MNWDRLKVWAASLKRDVMTLWFAARHPDVPWLPKVIGGFVVAYALSPIDLIPDFIPVLGLLDELVLLPGLIWLAMRLIPAPMLAQCRADAEGWWASRQGKPVSRWGIALVIVVWLAFGWAIWHWLAQSRFNR